MNPESSLEQLKTQVPTHMKAAYGSFNWRTCNADKLLRINYLRTNHAEPSQKLCVPVITAEVYLFLPQPNFKVTVHGWVENGAGKPVQPPSPHRFSVQTRDGKASTEIYRNPSATLLPYPVEATRTLMNILSFVTPEGSLQSLSAWFQDGASDLDDCIYVLDLELHLSHKRYLPETNMENVPRA